MTNDPPMHHKTELKGKTLSRSTIWHQIVQLGQEQMIYEFYVLTR